MMKILKPGLLILAALTFACSTTNPQKAHQVDQPQPDLGEGRTEKSKMVFKGGVLQEISCTLGTDKRHIEIGQTNQGCQVIYSKSGKTNKIASGERDFNLCRRASQEITRNLRSAGYTCN